MHPIHLTLGSLCTNGGASSSHCVNRSHAGRRFDMVKLRLDNGADPDAHITDSNPKPYFLGFSESILFMAFTLDQE